MCRGCNHSSLGGRWERENRAALHITRAQADRHGPGAVSHTGNGDVQLPQVDAIEVAVDKLGVVERGYATCEAVAGPASGGDNRPIKPPLVETPSREGPNSAPVVESPVGGRAFNLARFTVGWRATTGSRGGVVIGERTKHGRKKQRCRTMRWSWTRVMPSTR